MVGVVEKRRVVLGEAAAPGRGPGLSWNVVGPLGSAVMGTQGEEPRLVEEGC